MPAPQLSASPNSASTTPSAGPATRTGSDGLTTLRASGPGDLLALVPRMLGFHPEGSVVMLTVGGAAQPVHARVDLPSAGQPDEDVESDAETLADHLSTVAADNRVAEVALVVYGEDGVVARLVVDALTVRLAVCGVDVVCAVRADGSQWWWLDRDDDGVGTSYDVALHPLTVAGVVDGTVVHADRGQLAASLVGTDPQEIAAVAAHAGSVLDGVGARAVVAGTRPLPRRLLPGEARWIAARVRSFLADGKRLDSADVARLATLVTVSLDLRDVAWSLMSRADAGRHVDLWRDVVRRVPEELRAGPAAVLGFAAWLSGQGALAWCAVECCQRIDPGHSLARLLTDLLAGAVPPSAWRRPPPPELLNSHH